MSIRVKSFLKDVGGAGRVTKARREKLKNASAVPDPKDPIRDLADKLHPSEMQLRVTDIRDASPTAKTFRFEAVDGHIPVFQCGQFVNFRLKIGESLLTRPYTISSAPYEARGEHPFFEITVRRNVPYLVPDYFFENVHVGDVLTGALPFGTFYWEPLRDTTELVALAGGSGITPFYAMAKEIAHGKMHGCRLTILYGSVKSDDIVLKDELDQICAECPDVKVVHVLSDDPDWPGEHGFITREIIEKYAAPNSTFLFCGPLAMFRFVRKALEDMGVPQRRFRHDVVNNPADISTLPGYPKGTEEKTFRITVVRGIHEDVIDPGRANPSPSRSSAALSRSIPTAATASAVSAAASCSAATSSAASASGARLAISSCFAFWPSSTSATTMPSSARKSAAKTSEGQDSDYVNRFQTLCKPIRASFPEKPAHGCAVCGFIFSEGNGKEPG